MAEVAKQDGVPQEAEIIDLMDYVRRNAAPPATSAELEEYRRMWPLMMQMLKEWETIKGAGGCPIARRITTED